MKIGVSVYSFVDGKVEPMRVVGENECPPPWSEWGTVLIVEACTFAGGEVHTALLKDVRLKVQRQGGHE